MQAKWDLTGRIKSICHVQLFDGIYTELWHQCNKVHSGVMRIEFQNHIKANDKNLTKFFAEFVANSDYFLGCKVSLG